MNIQLLEQGLLLMVIGMGFVFFFLAIMIVCMNLNAKFMKIYNKYFPEPIEEDKYSTKKNISANNSADIALAIAIAFDKTKKTV